MGVGDVYRVLTSAEDGTGPIGFVDGQVPVGAGPLPHVHKHSDESFFVLSRTIAFPAGAKTITAEAGAFVHVPRGTLHQFMSDDLLDNFCWAALTGPQRRFGEFPGRPPGSSPTCCRWPR
jgi:Cupin domain